MLIYLLLFFRESNASNSFLNDSNSLLSQLENGIFNRELGLGIPARWRNKNKVEQPAPKKYYMLPIFGEYSVKISFDRLALLSLLDRYISFFLF